MPPRTSLVERVEALERMLSEQVNHDEGFARLARTVASRNGTLEALAQVTHDVADLLFVVSKIVVELLRGVGEFIAGRKDYTAAPSRTGGPRA